MIPRGTIAMTTVLLCFILGLLRPAPAAGFHTSKPCCTRYTRKPVPFQRIKGYRVQTPMANCRIEAIIFYTMRKNVQICATSKDGWVRKILASLSSKLKKTPKASSTAGETQRRESMIPSLNDGGGSFFSTTETPQNTTEFATSRNQPTWS